jgi:hypothetical protein
MQQRYAASKADLSDALACLRSDAAVNKLLARRVDELERRLEEHSLTPAVPAAAGEPQELPAAPSRAEQVQGVPAADAAQSRAEQVQGVPAADAEQAEQRCVSLAWQLEEARAALAASEAACAERAAACASAEQRASASQDEAQAAAARAEAADAALVQERALAQEASARHAGERKTMSREIKALRRDLASAQAAAASASAEAGHAAAGAVATQLSRCLREATLVRERMVEASVERLASAEQTAVDPLELLAVSDSRVALLAAEAQLLGRSSSQGDGASEADAEVLVRETLGVLLSDNASLRKRVNSLLRATFGAAAASGAPPAVGRGGRPWWQPGRE